MLAHKIKTATTGILCYGLTPPKQSTPTEKIQHIANTQIQRLKDIGIDALVLYDIQDESSRTDMPRPFPFLQTVSPEHYSATYLKELAIPKIIYQSIGKFTKASFTDWLSASNTAIDYTVFVGAPSQQQHTSLSLQDAYTLQSNTDTSFTLGGVTIPERHLKKGDEHLRVFNKMDKGCRFFISQCVYNIDSAKNFLSDYYYWAADQQKNMVPIIFTLTPCGSLKTLQFMEWLGIDIPKWLRNDLLHSDDILDTSISICKTIAQELIDFSSAKGIPIGFNIESVAIRKSEIEASIELLKDIKTMMAPHQEDLTATVV